MRLFAQPDTACVATTYPAKVVLAEAKNGAVVDHAAIFIAHRGVHDLADREPPDIAGHAGLQQQFGVRAGNLVFTQRR